MLINMQTECFVDDHRYKVELLKRCSRAENPNAVHVLVPTLILNDLGIKLVECCVKSFLLFSNEQVSIWIVDNHSPDEQVEKLKALDLPINLVLNRTEPQNRKFNPDFFSKIKRLRSGLTKMKHQQMYDASYANGVALEIGRQFIPAQSKTVFTIHSDTCVTHPNWLSEFKRHLSDTSPLVGGYADRTRIKALHVSALLINNDWLLASGESFMPNMHQERYPDRPIYDVGDGLTWRLRAENQQEVILPNTQNNPELIDTIPKLHHFKRMSTSPRVFDREGNIIFMHLGRGTVKASGLYQQKEKFTAQEWIELIDRFFALHVE